MLSYQLAVDVFFIPFDFLLVLSDIIIIINTICFSQPVESMMIMTTMN